MEVYDIIMLLVAVGAAVFGAWKGMAWQVASISSIVVSYLVAWRFGGALATRIDAAEPWNKFLAMLILYLGASLFIWMAFRLVSGSIEKLKLKSFDRQIGMLVGLGKGILLCAVITLFAVTLLGERERRAIVRSRSGHYIARLLHESRAIMPPEIHGVLQPYLEKFDERMRDAPGVPQSGPDMGWPIGDRNGDRNGIPELPQWPDLPQDWPSPNWPSTGSQPDSRSAPNWLPAPPRRAESNGVPSRGRY